MSKPSSKENKCENKNNNVKKKRFKYYQKLMLDNRKLY